MRKVERNLPAHGRGKESLPTGGNSYARRTHMQGTGLCVGNQERATRRKSGLSSVSCEAERPCSVQPEKGNGPRHGSLGGIGAREVRVRTSKSCCSQRRTLGVVRLPDGAYAIPLTRGYYAVVSAEDIGEIIKWRWAVRTHDTNTPYAYTSIGSLSGKPQLVQMHRHIMSPGPGKVIDHIDFDGLNNRRSNLRICSMRENSWRQRGPGSMSGYRGVFVRKDGVFVAQITHNGKHIYLGSFVNAIDGARAYDASAIRLKGEFACLNFPR